MKRDRFGSEAGRPFRLFDSEATVTPVMHVNGQLSVNGLHLPPGGRLGAHRGRMGDLLLITGGSGWVRNNSGAPEPLAAGDAVSWTVHETKELGTDSGLSAVWIQHGITTVHSPKRQFQAGGRQWSVYMSTGNDLEVKACDQLERLLNSYDLRKWSFTPVVRIVDFAIPHSHPSLTLNTRHVNDDLAALACFLHEQIHWFEEARPEQVAAAMSEFRELYPNAPRSMPEGAHDLESTYLHLIVCPLEYAALTELLGQERARELVLGHPFYTWVYQRTVEDWEQIRPLLVRHSLMIS